VSARRDRGEVVALTARLTAAIEAQIRLAPAEWVWWHERWRRRPPARDQPPRDVTSLYDVRVAD
jgi:lauroyl/myristoyl acyltransferase